MPVLWLGLFGGFRAALDAAPVPDSAWERPAARRLVKLLAVEPSHRLHRDQVLDQLWPDLAPDAASNTLRKALHQARRAVEPEARRASATYFQFQDETLFLSASVWIDIDAFESLAAHALRSHARPQLEEALAACGGALLPEDQYEDWVLRRREELDRTQRLLLHDYAALLTDADEHDLAIAQLRRSLSIDPLQEGIHRQLMQLLLTVGHREEAAQQYHLCREILEADLGLEPAHQTEALYQQALAPRLAVAEPMLPASIRRPPATPLVGREEVSQLLDDAVQQVTNGQGELVLVSGSIWPRATQN